MPSGVTTGVLRATPPDGPVVVFVTTGMPVQVLTGDQLIQGVVWSQVRLTNGVDGWIQKFLLRITSPL
jgi:SH3-like domain-containing protein